MKSNPDIRYSDDGDKVGGSLHLKAMLVEVLAPTPWMEYGQFGADVTPDQSLVNAVFKLEVYVDALSWARLLNSEMA